MWVGWLPADGQQANDNNGCGELVHALLDHDAVNGPASVVGQEGLPCGGSQGRLRGEPTATLPAHPIQGLFFDACLPLLWLNCQPEGP